MKPKTAPRWPKGPFPEKYRWDAVEARLAGGWDARREVLEPLLARAMAPRAGWEDPYLAILEGPLELPEVRAALADRDAFAFRWRGSARAGTGGARAIGIVPSRDPIVAAIAVGVAGPQHGIGTAAIVRFLVALRSFARFDVDELGEDAIAMQIVPDGPDAALRIAERVRQICPPMTAIDPEQIAARMVREERLAIEYC